jgi:hypothetical protein
MRLWVSRQKISALSQGGAFVSVRHDTSVLVSEMVS